jgi:two-component system, chemotaxis family, chemotaxis protein CheY
LAAFRGRAFRFCHAAVSALAGNNLTMAHCLIVDDSRVIRTIARRLFEELHFVTGEAEDGMTALRACREKMPDLILLDWSLPGMTGVEFVRSLRAQPDGGRPVILVSLTEIDPNEIAHAVAAGINDYVMKPFDREILSAKLAELFPNRSDPRPQSAAAGR